MNANKPADSINNTPLRESRKRYVDTIPDESVVIDFYESRTGIHYFEDYYYYEGDFYYDNGINYKVLTINRILIGAKFVMLRDIYGVKVNVYIHKFLEQHGLD